MLSSFLYFICIRHKWLIYVILWGYAYSIHALLRITDDLMLNVVNSHLIWLNPSFILGIGFDVAMTFRFIDYYLYEQNDVEHFFHGLVANLMFWMPIAFAIQMRTIKKYRKRNSKELASMVIAGKTFRRVGRTVIGLAYIWFIWEVLLSYQFTLVVDNIFN